MRYFICLASFPCIKLWRYNGDEEYEWSRISPLARTPKSCKQKLSFETKQKYHIRKKIYHYQKTECFFTCSAESSTDLYCNIRQKFKLTTVIIHFCLFYWPLTKIRYDSHLPEVRTTNYTNRSSHRAGLDINRSYSQVLWHPEDDPWH